MRGAGLGEVGELVHEACRLGFGLQAVEARALAVTGELPVAVGLADLPGVLVGRHGPLAVGVQAGRVLDAELACHVGDDLGRYAVQVRDEGPEEPDGGVSSSGAGLNAKPGMLLPACAWV